MCVFVCVHIRERDGKRERGRKNELGSENQIYKDRARKREKGID